MAVASRIALNYHRGVRILQRETAPNRRNSLNQSIALAESLLAELRGWIAHNRNAGSDGERVAIAQESLVAVLQENIAVIDEAMAKLNACP